MGNTKKEEVVDLEKAKVRMVTVRLPKTKENKSDVIVSVNGQTFQIKRGIEVEIPYYVEAVLKNTERMDAIAIERSEAAASKTPE